MSFRIQPIKEFLVRPALPAPLRRLPELGLNIMWSWHHSIRAVFRRLEPAIWRASGYNPVVMLGRMPQEVLERAAKDPRFLAVYRRACELYDGYLASLDSAAPATPVSDEPPMVVAYFSMEDGLDR